MQAYFRHRKDRISQVLLRPADNCGRVHRTGVARNLSAAFEERQRRDRPDIKLRGERLLGFGVDLGQSHARFELRCGCFKIRRHHFAGTAPFSPEIHQQRNIVFLDMAFELICRERQRTPLEKRAAAFAAFAMIAISKFRARRTVDSATMRANNINCSTFHRFFMPPLGLDPFKSFFFSSTRKGFDFAVNEKTIEFHAPLDPFRGTDKSNFFKVIGML